MPSEVHEPETRAHASEHKRPDWLQGHHTISTPQMPFLAAEHLKLHDLNIYTMHPPSGDACMEVWSAQIYTET